MRVLTLDEKDLDRHARMLAKAVAPKGHFDAIVGVKRGGAYVADAFCRHFPRDAYGLRSDVALQRPSTKKKGAGLARILKRLPLPLLDLMRMAEAKALEWLHSPTSPPPERKTDIPADLRQLLATTERPKILLIDDAIDSGDTLFAIVEALKNTNRQTRITTAVITVTTWRPRILPDFTLYKNRTLLRFPWSDDYRK